jgi:hypothetical protein
MTRDDTNLTSTDTTERNAGMSLTPEPARAGVLRSIAVSVLDGALRMD